MDSSFVIFLTFFLYAHSFSEDSMLNKLYSGGLWYRRQPQMIYVFFTNRNANVTHGNETFVPTPGVEDIYQRAVFYPNCDKIARLDINETVARYISNASFQNPPLVVYAQVGLNTSSNYTQRTPRKLYQNNSFVVGSYTVLVRMRNGIITNLTWDEGCLECSGNQCVDGNCGIDSNQCLNDNICGVKVFVGWIGTDGGGFWCTSASYVPSAFVIMSSATTPVYIQAAGGDKKNFIFF